MSDVGGEFAENCGFEGKILCEVPQGAHGCDSRDTCDTTTSEQLAEIEGQAEPVQVREGRWKTRGGDIRNVTPTPEGDGREQRFPWWDAQYRQTWTADGRYHFGGASAMDLVEYLGPIEQQPEPVPQPPMLQDADQMIRLLSEANHNHVAMIGRLQGRINDLETIRDNQAATIEESRSEVSHVQWLLDESRQRVTHLEELVTSLRNSNKAQEKAFTAVGKANTDLQHRLNVVSAEWAEQAETIKGLQARIFDLETINQAMEKAVNDAGKANNKLRTQAEEFRFEISYLQNLLGEERAKQADKLAQLETLQPIAAACHTAQTMVRDMLGHMRCLLALHHTTDRRSFCTLLESILEVFDEAECDEDEDDDTTCTSEAGQG